MCGILGTIPFTNDSLFVESLKKLNHRGPDGLFYVTTQEVTFGHTRLAILDLSSSGTQPMLDSSSRYLITFNGEIYNYIEIREELKKKGHVFRSTSDTEVLLYAFIEWGEKCVLKLNGMWAFAIWDKLEKSLFLSRDRFGKKPLFYSVVGSKLIFASEMKAIFPFLPSVNAASEFQWMSKNVFSYEATEKCLIDGIKRFPAGHFGFYQNGDLKITRYWNTLDHLVSPASKYESQVDEFRELLKDSCKLRMRSDVPIGTALSGGLDSSSIISLVSSIARTENSKLPQAFVATFPNTLLDEKVFAKQVIEHLQIKANYVEIDPLAGWENIYEYFYNFEELNLTSPLPMIKTYQAMKAQGVSVTLDGHGADELFCGYGHLIEALWDVGSNSESRKEILVALAEVAGNSASDSIKSDFQIYIKFMLKRLFSKTLKRGEKSKDDLHENYLKLDHFSQQLYVLFHETILPTLLRNYDRYSMMNGVEIRMPFMDHRIVSYVFSLPFSSKFHGGYTKKILRDAVKPFLPTEITFRKTKIGFNTPIIDWMQGPLKEFFEDTISSKEFLECNLISNGADLKKRIFSITNKEDSSWNSGEKAWTEFSPFLWERALIKGRRSL